MKRVFCVVAALALLLLMSVMAFGQAADTSPANLYAAGGSFNNGASPAIAGTGLWAHKIADNDGKPTYAFTAVDVLPNTLKPFTVSANFSTGIAQQVLTIGKVPIFIPTTAGIEVNGPNTGWVWTGGALADFKLKGNWHLLPNVRIVKGSVTNGTGYQPVVGIALGWGE